MDCFYHDGRAAVGTCRACLRGLCRECAADLDRALACRNRCEEHARATIAALDHSARFAGAAKANRGVVLGLAITVLLVGFFVIFWALFLPRYREVAVLGVPFLFIGTLIAMGLRGGGVKRAA